MVPSPELVKTREDASDKDNDASDEENEDYYSLADLPSKAQEMLMLGPYHKINLNLNPSHPFNHGNDVALRHAKAETKARNTKKHRIRRHARHPWNQS